MVEMSDGEDFELDSDESFGFTENENDAAWMTLHIVVQVAILIAAHVHKSALFVLFALFSQVKQFARGSIFQRPVITPTCRRSSYFVLPFVEKCAMAMLQVLMLLVFIKAKGLTDTFSNALITVGVVRVVKYRHAQNINYPAKFAY